MAAQPRGSLTAALVAVLCLAPVVLAACPYGHGAGESVRLDGQAVGAGRRSLLAWDATAVASLDIAAVKADLEALFTTSQSFWPADFGPDHSNYGPLMIRCEG